MSEMNADQLKQLVIKKAELLISKNIGNKKRLEQIQMKVARGLPLLTENKTYLEKLVEKNISNDEIQLLKNEVKNSKLVKSELSKHKIFHCICCGNSKKKLDKDGMCMTCYLDYNIKISKFVTKPIGGAISWNI